MAKVKRSANSAAIPTPAATAPKARKSAAAAAKAKGSAPAATEANRSAPAATEATADTTPLAKGAAAAAANVIEIPSSPDYSEGAARGSSKKKARKRPAPVVLDDEIEMWTPREKRRLEEDCQILSVDPLAAAEVAPAATGGAGNDDIAVVAERGKVACRDYPHPRSACAKHPFNTTPHERHCEKCFCYVCDIAAPCVSWMGPGWHCQASEKDMQWRNMRSLKRKTQHK